MAQSDAVALTDHPLCTILILIPSQSGSRCETVQQKKNVAAKVFESIGKFGLALAVTGGVVNSTLYNVDAGPRAVIFDRFSGLQDTVLPGIFASIREDYDQHVLPSNMTEILKSVVACFDAGELMTQRELVSRKEFTEVVEAKQVAPQEAERARFVVKKAVQQKKAAIIYAEGNPKAAELIANSMATTADGLIELHKWEAAKDIAYQLSCSRNITYLPVGQSVLL
ncbi:hypothetical protein P7K49_026805 [Saguinus oedipus]|uniref:Prohibitin n=1 Tax=Saguinus oedipus TaxID=9490 RepID=A0ABQ9UE98_SAGOE|nr:hypothetical protein P7K49_026805 [Saguinus oedipus]